MSNNLIFNKKQLASLAKLAYKFVELLVIAVVTAGFMLNDPPIFKIILVVVFIPIPLAIGLLIEAIGDDEGPPPP